MKLKPVYIYVISFIALIVILVIVTSDEGKDPLPIDVEPHSEMPNDDIHQNMGSAPASGNVSAEFKQKMANLKSQYEADPSDTSNAFEYARLLAAAHKPAESVEVYKSLLAANPDANTARFELATVYYNMQKFDDAKAELERVYENEPSAPDVQYNLGAVEAALGNNERAAELWQNVIDNYPGTEAARIASSSLQSLQ